jgi:hypothetical protein
VYIYASYGRSAADGSNITLPQWTNGSIVAPSEFLRGMSTRLPGYSHDGGVVQPYWPGAFTAPRGSANNMLYPLSALLRNDLSQYDSLFIAEPNYERLVAPGSDGTLNVESFRLVRPIVFDNFQVAAFVIDVLDTIKPYISGLNYNRYLMQDAKVALVSGKTTLLTRHVSGMGVDGLAQQIKATFLNDRTAQNNSTLTQLQAEFASALEYLGQVMRYPTRKGDGAYLLRAVTNILDNAALGRNLWPQVETLLLQHIFQTRQWSEFPGVSTDLRADVVARKVAAVTAEVEKRVPTNATSYTFGDSGYRILVGSVPAVADIKHLMFKVLSPEGQAIHSGSSRGFQWPLPTRNTTTGRWEQAQPTTPIVGTVKACNSGYHLAPGTNLLTWLAPRGSNAVSIWLGKYTIAEGNDADIETDKIAVRQVTLTRGFENTLNPKTARAWVANFIQTYLFTAEELASDTFKPVVDFIKSVHRRQDHSRRSDGYQRLPQQLGCRRGAQLEAVLPVQRSR